MREENTKSLDEFAFEEACIKFEIVCVCVCVFCGGLRTSCPVGDGHRQVAQLNSIVFCSDVIQSNVRTQRRFILQMTCVHKSVRRER